MAQEAKLVDIYDFTDNDRMFLLHLLWKNAWTSTIHRPWDHDFKPEEWSTLNGVQNIQAKTAIRNGKIENLFGRLILVDLSKDSFDPSPHDRAYGPKFGCRTAQRIVNEYRAKKAKFIARIPLGPISEMNAALEEMKFIQDENDTDNNLPA